MRGISIVSLLFLFLFSCMDTGRTATTALTLQDNALARRSMESRIYDTSNEKEVLSASAALLQDISYQIEESETKLGVITASRDKSAVKNEEVAFQFALAVLGGTKMKYDKEEKVYVTVVTKAHGPNQTKVRATFQHVVYDNEGVIVRNEQITDPLIYQEFFSKLSKAIFLEAHSI